MQKVHVITIFDKNYLGRAMAFRESLHQYSPDQHVHFLCLDELCLETAAKLHISNTTLLRVEDLHDSELEAARNNRTMPEFASTCKPAFLLHMLKSGQVGPNDLMVFIDPDFAFYASPEDLWKRMYGGGSIIVTPHRFPPHRAHEAPMKGAYNAGIVGFRNDQDARACLTEWRRQCIDWCYLRYEDGKIADQGYMSSWKQNYHNVYELMDKGVNLANWNIENYSIRHDSEGFLIDGERLVCYHFHGAKLYVTKQKTIGILPSTSYHPGIYAVYADRLTVAYEAIWQCDPSWKLGTLPHPGALRLLKQTIWKRIF